MQSVHSKCIVCATDFDIQPGNCDKDIPVTFQRIWDSFLSHFNLCPSTWKDLFDYYSQLNEIPFCLSCRNNVSNLVVLEDKVNEIVTKIKSQISKEVATISLKIVQSSSNLLCHPHLDPKSEVEVAHQSIDQLHINSNEIVTKKIIALRHKIFQDLNPHIHLEDCQNNVKKDSQLLCKVTPIIVIVEPLINKHMSNSPDDKIHIKRESGDLELMQDYCNSTKIKFEQIKTEQHKESDHELNDDNDPLYVQPSKPRKRTKTNAKRIIIKRKPAPEDSIHKCELCQKTFTRNFNLLRHSILVHHKKWTKVGHKKKNVQHVVKLVNLGHGKFDYGGFAYEKKGDKYECCTCGAGRTAEFNIKIHIRYDHVMKTPVNMLYNQKYKKNDIVQSQHPKQMKYKPDIPGSVVKNFGNGEYLYKGTLRFRRINEGDYECLTCFKHCSKYQRIYSHVKTVHDQASCSYICKSCNVGFESKNPYMKHRRSHESKRWLPGSVPGSFVYDGKFEFDTVENGYQCGECGSVKKQIWDLTKHIKWSHANVENASCPKCFMHFQDRAYLNKHIANQICVKTRWTHLDAKNILLDEKWPVEIFDKTDDNGQTKQRFKCVTCGQERAKKCDLKDHIDEKHINPGAFPCPKCTRSFGKPYELNLHDLRIHSEDRNFACDVPGCQQKFKMKRQLVIHVQKCINKGSTTGEKRKRTPVNPRFICSHCGLGYTTLSKLDNHLKGPDEDNGKIFKCYMCDHICPTSKCFDVHLLYHYKS